MNEKELELAKIGMAFYAVGRRDIGEQDSRGWNKCMDAIWSKYKEIANGAENS